MPQNITGTNVNTSPIVVPDNGDPVDGAGLALATQGLANTITYTQDKILGIGPDRFIAIPMLPIMNFSNIWTNNVGDAGGMGYWIQSTNAGGEIQFPLPVLPFGFLKEVYVWLVGQGHGALPANKPRLRVYKRLNVTTVGGLFPSSSIEGATITDGSANVAAYEVVHSLAKTGMALALDYAHTYNISVIGESSTNAIANGLLLQQVVIKVGP
jgi:hypothetical protein